MILATRTGAKKSMIWTGAMVPVPTATMRAVNAIACVVPLIDPVMEMDATAWGVFVLREIILDVAVG